MTEYDNTNSGIISKNDRKENVEDDELAQHDDEDEEDARVLVRGIHGLIHDFSPALGSTTCAACE